MLLRELHFCVANTCSSPCNDITYIDQIHKYDYNNNCYDLVRLLDKIFIDAEENDEYVDF